jgi:CheY-like chemotaxis protein
VVLSAGGAGLIVSALAPRGYAWVIYNMPLSGARRVIADALRSIGMNVRRTRSGFVVDDGTLIEVDGFPFLRNVSVRLRDGDKNQKLARMLESALSRSDSPCGLTEKDGRKLVETLQTEFPKTRYIIVSGYADNLLDNSNFPIGQFAFLQKPYSIRVLAQKIREVLEDGPGIDVVPDGDAVGLLEARRRHDALIDRRSEHLMGLWCG